jgi:hypothetical protein
MRLTRAKVVELLGWATLVVSLALITWLYATVPGRNWPVAFGSVIASDSLGHVSPRWRQGGSGVHTRSTPPGGKVELFELTYAYEVSGQRFTGREKTTQRWPSRIEVHYNPENPAQSVLARGPNTGAVMVLAGMGFIGFVVAKVAGAGVAPRGN